MSLLVLLPTSSFSLKQFLNQQIQQGQATSAQVNYAASIHVISALKLKLKQYTTGSDNWLNSLTLLASKDISATYELAMYYKQVGNEQQYLYWLNLGSKQSYPRAKLDLISFYYQQEQYSQVIAETEFVAIPVNTELNLERIASIELADNFLALRAKALLVHGKMDELIAFQAQFHNEPLYPIIQNVMRHLTEFKVFEHTSTRTDIAALAERTQTKQCPSSISLIATQYEDLEHLKGSKMISQRTL